MFLGPQLHIGWECCGFGFVLFHCEVLEVSGNTNTIHLVENVLVPVIFLSMEDILQEAVV